MGVALPRGQAGARDEADEFVDEMAEIDMRVPNPQVYELALVESNDLLRQFTCTGKLGVIEQYGYDVHPVSFEGELDLFADIERYSTDVTSQVGRIRVL
jgi:hypothetical protein